MRIKGLLEKLGVPEEQIATLERMRLARAVRELQYLAACRAAGISPYHGVDRAATQKRRAKNKVGRASRKTNIRRNP